VALIPFRADIKRGEPPGRNAAPLFPGFPFCWCFIHFVFTGWPVGYRCSFVQLPGSFFVSAICSMTTPFRQPHLACISASCATNKRVYQGQVVVLLKFEVRLSGHFFRSLFHIPLELCHTIMFCSYTFTRCIGFHRESRLIFRATSRNICSSWSAPCRSSDPTSDLAAVPYPQTGCWCPAELSHGFANPSNPLRVITIWTRLVVQHEKRVRKRVRQSA
jgi:hypothetical protein